MGHNVGILALNNTNTLYKYSTQDGKINVMCKKELPPNVGPECVKYPLGNGQVVLQGGNKTIVCGHELVVTHRYSGEYGELIGTVGQDKIVYCNNQDKCVEIYNIRGHRHEMTLKSPPHHATWSCDLSVCSHPHTGSMVVVDGMYATMDIYDRQGKFILYS